MARSRSSRRKAPLTLSAGAFPFLTLSSPDAFVNLVEFFDSGRKTVPGSAPLLGRRPLLSTSPLTYANHYEWISWETADIRRQYIGSGLQQLFASGVVGGGPMRSFGIYSGNCPGKCHVDGALDRVPGAHTTQSGSWSTLRLTRTTSSPSRYTIHSAGTLSVSFPRRNHDYAGPDCGL